MKFRLFFAAVASALMLAACSNDENAGASFSKETVSATFSDAAPATRTSLNSNLQVLWNEGDEISVFATDGEKIDNNRGTLVKGAGTMKGDFELMLQGERTDKIAAVYPYYEETAYNGIDVVTINMPDTYSYAENGISGSPMAYRFDKGGNLISFKNAGALFALTIKNMPAGYNKVILKSLGDEAVAGECVIEFNDESVPVLSASGAEGKEVTINIEPALMEKDMTFYFPLIVAEKYGKLQFSISNGSKEKVVFTKENVKVERNKRYYKTITIDNVTGSVPVNVTGSEAAYEALLGGEKSLNVTLGSEESPVIKFPTTDDATVPTTLSFAAISSETPVEIKEADGAQNVSSQIYIYASSEEESNNSFNINMPNSTVMLNADGETAVYEKVTALTAANTLVVGAGVTINNLVVVGGNVKVYGEVKAISRAAGNADEATIIILEDGIIPENIGEGFIVVGDEDKWDGVNSYAPKCDETTKTYTVTNAYELAWFANEVNSGNTMKGYTISLAGDIDLNYKNWTAIGTSENPFCGTFDGGNNIIKNLGIVETEAKEGKAYLGLFGYAKDATIKNVEFYNVNINVACLDIDHSQGHIGAVAGSVEGTCTIENVTVKGDVKVYATQDANGASRVAVIAGGNAYGNVTMKNVHVVANAGSYLKANNNTGALAGQLQGKSVFENCSSNIDVTVNKFFAGGIIGIAAGDQTFTNCHTTGNIAVVAGRSGRANDHYRVGGIAGGWADGKTKVCTLTNCSYEGEISGKSADGSVAEAFDYAGYVGRGYTLNGCAGSKVTIDGVSYVQAYDNVYGIYKVNDAIAINKFSLKWFRDQVNDEDDANTFAGQTLVMVEDIDLENEQWLPIGYWQTFNGTFDGQGHTISNLKHHSNEADCYIGFFGYLENATIKNLVVENVDIKMNVGTNDWAGGHCAAIAGNAEGTCTFENITVKGLVKIQGADGKEGSSRIAAIVGGGQGTGTYTINNVNVDADAGSYVKANNNAGGIAGQLQGEVKITNSSSNIDVTVELFNAGGIIGLAASNTTIENCTTAGKISVTTGRDGNARDPYRLGTIIGSWDDNVYYPIIINDCSTTATLSSYGATVFDFEGYIGRGYSDKAGAGIIINGKEYVYHANGIYYTMGQVVEVAGQKGIVYSLGTTIKVVSVEVANLKSQTVKYAKHTWAPGLGEGWALPTIIELDAIWKVREELNKSLEADDANNVLFVESAKYVSSSDAVGSDISGAAYESNSVHVKYFNEDGYLNFPYSAAATVRKESGLNKNYFARAVYEIK